MGIFEKNGLAFNDREMYFIKKSANLSGLSIWDMLYSLNKLRGNKIQEDAVNVYQRKGKEIFTKIKV